MAEHTHHTKEIYINKILFIMIDFRSGWEYLAPETVAISETQYMRIDEDIQLLAVNARTFKRKQCYKGAS